MDRMTALTHTHREIETEQLGMRTPSEWQSGESEREGRKVMCPPGHNGTQYTNGNTSAR